MDLKESIKVAVPADIRKIFGEWAKDFAAAPAYVGAAYNKAVADMFRQLAAPQISGMVSRRVLIKIFEMTAPAPVFDKTDELQVEHAAVDAWLAPIIAADPILCSACVRD